MEALVLTEKDVPQRPRLARIRPILARLFALALVVAPIHPPAAAQEFRGVIQGRVTDNTGATIPGVIVTATNRDTNSTATATTNESGNYTVPFLVPGPYKVSAELEGFKKIERDGVTVRIGDRIEEVVSVSASTPLLDNRSGSTGQVIDEKRLALMPLSDGNPFVLTRLAPGIAYTGDLKFSRPFDNGGVSDVSSNGSGARGNEFTLDGAPNTTGLQPARRRRPGIQGRDRQLRRPARPHRRRHDQRDHEERHEPAQGRGLLSISR
jgi:Carboxypeptidase regulatory-like domain